MRTHGHNIGNDFGNFCLVSKLWLENGKSLEFFLYINGDGLLMVLLGLSILIYNSPNLIKKIETARYNGKK